MLGVNIFDGLEPQYTNGHTNGRVKRRKLNSGNTKLKNKKLNPAILQELSIIMLICIHFITFAILFSTCRLNIGVRRDVWRHRDSQPI
jgi:hypothetical protein